MAQHFFMSVAALMAVTPVVAESQKWAESLDLPVPDGFVEDETARVDFDTPAGRVVDLRWAGAASLATVIAFYEAALPQLGWRLQSETRQGQSAEFRYEREGERLGLSLTAGERETVLRVTLEPAASGH